MTRKKIGVPSARRRSYL